MKPALRKASWAVGFVLLIGLPALLYAQRDRNRSKPQAKPDKPAPTATSDTSAPGASEKSGTRLKGGQKVGTPQVFENLTVFPITSKNQQDIGTVTTLAAALRAGKAEVRELGAVRRPLAGGGTPVQNDPRAGIDNAQVGQLVIENKGPNPIFVLAGTVVKGGKQDRQIAQDFIVAANDTVPVDAFCVEQGRWNANRQGAATYGQFSAGHALANSTVRRAAQYKGNQGEVWAEVGKMNAAHGKNPRSGTLLATLDDKQLAQRKANLSSQVDTYLQGVLPQASVVGFAYAVDGKIKGVRWFAHHKVFSLFRKSLVDTSALDAITVQGGQPAQAPPALASRAVVSFINEIDAAKSTIKQTQADNMNAYAESPRGYGAKTMLKAPPVATATVQASAPVSVDYVAK